MAPDVHPARIFYRFIHAVSLFLLTCSAYGCGGGPGCDVQVGTADPSGRWTGTLTRFESDCGGRSYGTSFAFDHDISLDCNSNGDTQVYLFNEDDLDFTETSYSDFSGGSFTVQNVSPSATIEISYNNFDGSLADVTEKIRIYSGNKLVCSERYKGQARKQK